MTATLDIQRAPIPDDNPPPTEMPEGASSYDPEFPGSTPDAPYGYKPDGTPYKRRPNGGRSSGAKVKTTGGKVNESQARAAASLLVTMNNLIGISLQVFGMPMTGQAIADANGQFEVLAIEALKADPKLCRKIMAMGATSGRTALVMAYGTLAMSALPAARAEFLARRAAALEASDDE